MLDKKKKETADDNFEIDESQFEVDKSDFEVGSNEEKQVKEVEETEVVEIDEKKETIRFPWFIAIVICALMVLIIACIIVIKALEG